jgi:single-strand DNA-binding protein
VYVEGRLKTRKWQDKEGKDNYTTEIVADNMQMLGGREGAGGDEAGGQARGSARDRGDFDGGGERSAPRAPQRPAAKPEAARPAAAQKASTGFDDMDDDIPF